MPNKFKDYVAFKKSLDIIAGQLGDSIDKYVAKRRQCYLIYILFFALLYAVQRFSHLTQLIDKIYLILVVFLPFALTYLSSFRDAISIKEELKINIKSLDGTLEDASSMMRSVPNNEEDFHNLKISLLSSEKTKENGKNISKSIVFLVVCKTSYILLGIFIGLAANFLFKFLESSGYLTIGST
jgi:hypothetical protein